MSTELQVTQPTGTTGVLTVDQMRSQIGTIHRAMKSVMKKDVHFGTIPGTNKPSLYKAGSEVLLTMFHIAVEISIDDLSSSDEIRYRVTVTGRHQGTGIVMGQGVGEASTSEEKYRWRNAVCDEEFQETPEDRRRTKWKRYGREVSSVPQVRTAPADLANTVLKMAKKRGQVDMTLTALAASDIFGQDVADGDEKPTTAEEGADRQASGRKPETQPPRAQNPNGQGSGGGSATEKQQKLVRARLDNSGIPENALLDAMEIESIAALPFAKVDAALSWIQQHSS